MKKIVLICLSALFVFSSCKDMFEPEIENNLELKNAYDNAAYAQGLLLNGYTRLPTNSWSFNDVATDNAVSNDRNNGFLKMATGQWTAMNNPVDQWRNSRSAIQYLNQFFAVSDSVDWAREPIIRTMFNDRMKGEAYGLRALFMFYLLQSHGGKTESGELLGVPLLQENETVASDFNQPRATFDACLQQLYSDLDKAEELLPLDYKDDSPVPAKYTGTSADDYHRVFGASFMGRMTARIAKGIRVRAALLAASPAYNTGNVTKWEQAANFAAEVLDLRGGITNMTSNDLVWYNSTGGIDGLAAGANPTEILWRGNVGTSNDLERDNFPPTLNGNGRVNPSQNLVNAFPMANGYPITDLTNSGFNASSPYNGRDPRLNLYILINGGTAGTSNTPINTSADGTTNDGLNKVETSTRTGYYLKKLLRQDVNLNPTSTTTQKHFNPHIRYTEIYLAYAEAANEAWGPLATGGHSYSAYDVIKAIRRRAGVGVSNGDPYLESIKSDKNAMRELIRNERRLELCFEGFRFWDLRRWNANLNEEVKGVSISGGNFNTINVENRAYQSYMIYGPIPYSETLKYNNLVQNAGWR
ncbi:RagB/SusD family nutrient uptake outer membrane protein [Pararcticibacter amylolyticus]|uniref:RagB/SusD family nutrient uptake outer membrane protein n=1 Tax=Pararcticibacter amylolyticus TaxID=2173175 RepID=A0A2U2PJ80_9SPHI|nr:RagB/SusD family nutrient uptake outer membrane protein [Pararcticibacter amylolyticus]PWG81322.1 RagB/SusD family nutrient uptake outer membrane protein [Pararcticibacter amylolyticus]